MDPKASSTPNGRISGRKSYRMADIQSPIPGNIEPIPDRENPSNSGRNSSKACGTAVENGEMDLGLPSESNQTSNIEDSDNSDDSSYEELSTKEIILQELQGKSQEDRTGYHNQNPAIIVTAKSERIWNLQSGSYVILLPLFIAIISAFVYHLRVTDIRTEHTCVGDISKGFPEQIPDFWASVDTSIEEIKRIKRPHSIVFLYDDKSQAILEQMLMKISEYATCKITFCTAEPIILNSDYFQRDKILTDYGTVISENRENLTKYGVMIVKNLEKISGKSAQAFHSLCDEYNPVVGRALFLFTMKVDELPTARLATNYLEKQLEVLWKDMKKDNFQPLITRMTGFVLPVTSS